MKPMPSILLPVRRGIYRILPVVGHEVREAAGEFMDRSIYFSTKQAPARAFQSPLDRLSNGNLCKEGLVAVGIQCNYEARLNGATFEIRTLQLTQNGMRTCVSSTAAQVLSMIDLTIFELFDFDNT